ncbi:MAG: family 78 glycoside hydrolase catalytic domain [Acutalibacteraceae bacterium]|nr:family 78 glycoside hydrolase catalytic domain [Acutalibacteraceae bacterium]
MNYPDCFIAAGYEYASMEHFVSAPFFRKKFTASKIESAEVIIGAAGFYKLFINGKDITKGELAPYISNLDELVYYDSYDVSKYVNEGENVIAVLLGNGFQNNPGGAIWDFDKAKWRGAPKFAMSLNLVDGNGNTTVIESDESFKVCDSPILFDDFRCGEYYDARQEIDNFHTVDFDDGSLKNAIKVSSPRGEKRLCAADPIRFYGEIKPVSVAKHLDGWLYDFGENNTGVCKLSVNGTEGQKITLYYGEWIKDGVFCRDNIGFYNKQTDLQKEFIQKSEYICKAGSQTHIPSFIYNGFRYVYVKGITEEQATKDLLTYLKMSSLEEKAGEFSCSDEVVNKIQEITVRSDISNFNYFPTDCPQREKNGWTADASLSAEQLLLNFHPENGYKEWMRSIYKALNDKGQLPGIVPTTGWGYHWGNGPAWDNVIINLPYYTYIYRGDKEMLEELSTPLMRYLNYLFSRLDEKGLMEIGLGDWCQPGLPEEAFETPLVVTDTILTYDIADKAAFVYSVLKQEPQRQFALALADKVKTAFRENLLNKQSGEVYGNTQTGQAMAIFYGMLTEEEKPKALDVLLKYIDEADGHFKTGVLGGRVIYRVLSENGEIDLAYNMITRPDYPSYGNWVKRGATTLWEAFHPEDGPTLSLNHHFWGDVSAWFYIYLAGMRINPTGRDVANVDIKPLFPEKLDSVKACHNTPNGKISVAWKRADDGILLEIDAADKLYGKITLPDGYKFADGTSDKELESGSFNVLKA